MNLAYLRPVADHLWQSTLFAGLAGLLAVLLRSNRARVRHWLWLAASCKFLVPLSVLVAVGGHFASRTVPLTLPSGLSGAIEQAGQPFTGLSASTALVLPAQPIRNLLPYVLPVFWMSGFAGIAFSWWIRWRRIRATVRDARPVALALQLPVRSSAALLEPGIFGVLRPVLLLPEGIFERLTTAQFEAVLAHELCHFRCRDNLAATVQMFIETVFWFHPLIWWIGKRMIWERERACDEEVLRMGSQPQVYAEGILNVCKLYVESPLACVPGVTGANLKRRIEAIMDRRLGVPMNLARRAMLGAAALAAVALPIGFGIVYAPVTRAQSPDPSAWQAAAGGKRAFEVASVKPDNGPFHSANFPLDNGTAFTPGGRFSADFPVLTYIQFAYKIRFSPQQREYMLSHGQLPKWAESDRYAVEAKASSAATKDQMRLMMQSLLAERFHFEAHFETQETAVMTLTLLKPGKPGPKLRLHSEGPPCEDLAAAPPQGAAPGSAPPALPRCEVQSMTVKASTFHAASRNTSMDQLAEALPGMGALDRPVVDQTGFTARIDYELEWAKEPNPGGPPDPNPPADPGPSFLQALREQLGLKLEPARAPLRVLVIDRIERPSAN